VHLLGPVLQVQGENICAATTAAAVVIVIIIVKATQCRQRRQHSDIKLKDGGSLGLIIGVNARQHSQHCLSNELQQTHEGQRGSTAEQSVRLVSRQAGRSAANVALSALGHMHEPLTPQTHAFEAYAFMALGFMVDTWMHAMQKDVYHIKVYRAVGCVCVCHRATIRH
jgi:hypothetical protein